MFFRFKIIPTKPIEKTIQVNFKIKLILIHNTKNLGVLGFEPNSFELKVQCSTNWAIHLPVFIKTIF